MIWRIRERSAFRRLADDGQRARAGALWCTYVLDPTATPPRVAFALGRALGSAVTRNQLRRRLRVLLGAAALPAGWYLVGARPAAAARSFAELGQDIERLTASITAAAGSSA